MEAFNNDHALKEGLLVEVQKHYLKDQIIKGSYGIIANDGLWKGCAIGCVIHSYNILTGENHLTDDHSVFEKFGIPKWFAMIADDIFEALPQGEYEEWPYEFLDAIHVGADLNKAENIFIDFLKQENPFFKKEKYSLTELMDLFRLSMHRENQNQSKTYDRYSKKLIEILQSI